MWMTWWYVPWLGEMEVTVGVEQEEMTKERPSEVVFSSEQSGTTTQAGASLATRGAPAEERPLIRSLNIYFFLNVDFPDNKDFLFTSCL